ncbi:helix-turn-helix domain-containing protein [Massilia sp. Root351]|uniref:helix-turn-helix domain-containing protein n=1 Tax=Massilia sp. Root351 TaxID=1736522 RepID=UPI0009EB9E28|nr:helix-turn-helix domain-containing protein [Massilia sp. Root351]
MDNPDTLNVTQAAALLFADTDTVLLLARQGALPGTKIGKCWVFLRDDILEFLRRRIQQDTDERRRLLDQPKMPVAELVPVPNRGRRRNALPVLPSLAPPSSGPSSSNVDAARKPQGLRERST